jgi:DNA-binding SARP family transcriptional activator
VEFRILGRLEVIEHGQQLALGGAKQRALMAVLLLRPGTAASVDLLVEQLWGECPPPTAAKTVQVYVSRLRKVLGDGLVETRGRGYALAVDPAQIDAGRFAALASAGRAALDAGDAKGAIELLGAALELWRGSPLEEFVYEPFAAPEIERLEEARLAAVEDRVDAKLRVGRGAELVLELGRLVAEHPLRERLVAGLMLALYRGGRQSEALVVYRAARDRLVEELGLEPGPELGQLQQRILQHDSTLATRRPAVLPARPRRARGRLVPAVAALVMVALLTAGFLFSSGAAHSGQATKGRWEWIGGGGHQVGQAGGCPAVRRSDGCDRQRLRISMGRRSGYRIDLAHRPALGRHRRPDPGRRRAREHRERRWRDMGGELRRRHGGPD